MNFLGISIKNYKFRNTLVLVMVLLALIPAIVLSLMLTQKATIKNIEETTHMLTNTASAITRSVDLFLKKHELAISTIAKSMTKQNVVAKDEIESWLSIYHSQYPDFLTMLTTDKLGIMTAGYPGFTRDGKPYDPSGTSVADRPYFVNAIDNDSTYVSDVFLGRGFGQDPIIAISSSYGDPTIGIVEGSLDLNYFKSIENKINLFGAELLILDNKNRVIYSNAPEALDTLEDMTDSDIYKSKQNSNNWRYTTNGIDHFVVEKQGDYKWKALLSLHDKYFDDFERTQYFYTLAWLAVMLVLVLITVYLFSNSVIRPLENLEKQVRYFNPKLMPTKPDSNEGPLEIQSLSQYFYKLKLRLSATHQQTQHVLESQENIIRERTVELQNSMIAAQAASKSKSTFLANMSHEIRTPMNGVMGMIDLILNNPLTDKQKKRALTIKSSANAMLNIINDILDFSKIEAGKLEIVNHEFHFDDFMHDFLASISTTIQDKRLELNYTHDPEIQGWFDGDSSRVRQILTNLVNNAVKFTEKGGVSINVSVNSKVNDEYLFRFDVSDTGIGINGSRQKAIFERFTQADNSITRTYGGTGLGLSICKQLTNLMGGEIGFSSELDKGSDFWFTVKLSKVEDPELELSSPSSYSVGLNNAESKVLIVDDNDTNTFVAKEMLDYLNVKADVAYNGKEAIAKLHEQHFDLIFMDCHMPIMDGYEATQKIRETQFEKNSTDIPIVAFTASAMKGDRERCEAAGMDDYLTKPIHIEFLQEKLTKWLKISPPSLQPNKSSPDNEIVTQSNNKNLLIEDELVFDVVGLRERLSINETLLKSVLDGFFETIDEKVANLKKVVKAKKMDQIISVSHDIKGATANLSFNKFSQLMKEMEQSAKDKNLESVQNSLTFVDGALFDAKEQFMKHYG